MQRHAALLTVLAGTALVVVPAGPAAAAACPRGPGVTVVVDFASLGGGVPMRCTKVDPPTGLAALRDTGFTPTRAAQQPGYFVCRIDGKPAHDPCQRTSPASAYWSYWHAKPGGSWRYSDLGAADYDPPAGTVEGWAFGAGKPPSSAPPALAAAASPAASPAPTPSPSTSPARTAAAAVATTTRPTAGRPAAAQTSAQATPDVTSPESPEAAPDPSPSPSGDRVGSFGGPATGVPHSSPAGPLVAAGVVALLLAGAAAAVVRRRRSDGG